MTAHPQTVRCDRCDTTLTGDRPRLKAFRAGWNTCVGWENYGLPWWGPTHAEDHCPNCRDGEPLP